jgi:hypothetical protein
MKSIVGLGHCGCCLFHLAWLLQLWIFCVFWPSIAPFNKPLKNFMQTHKFGGCGWCGNLNFLNTFMLFFCKGQKRRHFWIMFKGWKRRHFHFSWGKKGRIPTESLSLFLTHTFKKVILLYYCHTMHNAPWRCFMFYHFFYSQSIFSSISKMKNTL